MKNTLIAILIFVGIIVGLYYIGAMINPHYLTIPYSTTSFSQGVLHVVVMIAFGVVYTVVAIMGLCIVGLLIIGPVVGIKKFLDERDGARKKNVCK